MTKKDYIIIARAIKEARNEIIKTEEENRADAKPPNPSIALQAIRHIIGELEKALKSDNALFDVSRFENAIYND